jgi:nicotinic acid mononucleotide adenylyltransferase
MTSVVAKSSLPIPPSTSSSEGLLQGRKVVIYTPITGNPPHLGHLNVAADAVKTAFKAGAVACKVLFSLASQRYLEGKQASDNFKLSQQQREELMQLTICDSQELFPPEVIPQFCGFEGQGQHIQKYRDVQSQNPDSRVFLAAGADLQIRMQDWQTQQNFFAFIQNRGSDKGAQTTNRIVLEESQAFTNISSSEIRKAILSGKEPLGIGSLATDYLKKIVPLPFRFQDLQKRFGSYEHLLAEIERRFPNLKSLTKNFSVTPHPDFGAMQLPVAILERPLAPTLENLRQIFNLANGISINRSYPKQKHDIEFNEKGKTYTCFRPNHNGTHSYRQVRYLEVLLDLTKNYGRKEAKDFCQRLTDEEIVNLKLATFFLRAGRLDESGPESPDPKRLRSFELYQHYATCLGVNPKLIEETQSLILDSCTPNNKLDYKNKEPWNPKAFLQTLLTLAHEIDLVRCFPNFETITKPNLVENLSGWVLDPKTNAESVAKDLQDFGIEANQFVGQQVQVTKKPYDLLRFYVHSTYGEYCRYRLEKLKFSIKATSSLPSAAGQATSFSKPQTKGNCNIM